MTHNATMQSPLPTGWRIARFDEVLAKTDRKIVLDNLATYNCVGVRWYGMGTFVRGRLLGLNISRKQQWIIKNGDVVYNKLFAWKGAFAIADPSVDGCIVSDKFPTYQPRLEVIEPRFLERYFRTPRIAQQAQDLSKGAAAISKLTLNPPQFWDLTIPLPPLDEQRRIVARIEALAAKVEEARGLRQSAGKEAAAILDSALSAIWTKQDNWTTQPVGKLASTVEGQVNPQVEPYASLPHINGEAMESGTCRLLTYRLAKEDNVKSGKFHFPQGAILYSKIRPYLRKAVHVSFEGVCSADVYAFDWVSPELEPRFFMYSLVSPQFTEYANTLSGRTRMPKLNQNQLFAFQLPFPPLPEQRHIVAYLDGLEAKVDKLKSLQVETTAELDALLPSILDRAFRGEL
jgi:type I restriction enzyme, S subunit